MMIRSSAAPAALPRRIRFVPALLMLTAAAGASLHGAGSSNDVTVEPRIVEARLGRVSLEQVEVSLRVALRRVGKVGADARQGAE